MKLFNTFPLLFIANDQSWKDPEWKHSELTSRWSVWNVFILWNSKKYLVTCLHENKNFFSFCNLLTIIVKQFNIYC